MSSVRAMSLEFSSGSSCHRQSQVLMECRWPDIEGALFSLRSPDPSMKSPRHWPGLPVTGPCLPWENRLEIHSSLHMRGCWFQDRCGYQNAQMLKFLV